MVNRGQVKTRVGIKVHRRRIDRIAEHELDAIHLEHNEIEQYDWRYMSDSTINRLYGNWYCWSICRPVFHMTFAVSNLADRF